MVEEGRDVSPVMLKVSPRSHKCREGPAGFYVAAGKEGWRGVARESGKGAVVWDDDHDGSSTVSEGCVAEG